MDDGELFLEYSQSESVALDDGRIKSAAFDTTQGFGLRAVVGRGGRLCPCLGTVGGGDPPGRGDRPGGRRAAMPAAGGAAAGHQPHPLYRPQPARHGRSCGQDQAVDRDRRLCPQPRPAGPPGHGLALRRLAGGADHAPRRPAGRATSGRWSASTSRSWSARATGMETGSHGAGGRVTLRALSRSGDTGRRRSTRRCARRW